MWWQQVPSAVLVWAFLSLPVIPAYAFKPFMFGDKRNRKDMISPMDRKLGERDKYITGSFYTTTGLEFVPEVD